MPDLPSSRRLTLALAALLALAPAHARAEEPATPTTDPRQAWTVSFTLENDLFAETDQAYTNGVGISWISPDTSDYFNDPNMPGWVRWVNRELEWLHGGMTGDETLQRNLVISLGQKMFTPADPGPTALIEDDRPYAGWLYLGFGYHARSRLRMDSLELNLGVVGPSSLAEEAQNFIHDLRGFERFNGWDNQLSDEPGVQLIYELKRQLLPDCILPVGMECDLIGHAGFSLGNVATYLNAGGEFRLGWDIPADFGTSSLRPGGSNSAPRSRWDPRLRDLPFGGIHAFVSLDGRLVGRDITLDGNTFEDSHSVDKRYLVGDAAVGVSGLFYGFKLSFARVFTSQEFEGQADPHTYGSVSLSYSRPF